MASREELVSALELAYSDKNVAAANAIAKEIQKFDAANAGPIDQNVMRDDAQMAQAQKKAEEQYQIRNMTPAEWYKGTAQRGAFGTLAAISAGSNLVADIFRDEPLLSGGKMERFGKYYELSQDMLKEFGSEPFANLIGGSVSPYSAQQLAAADPMGGYATPMVEAATDPSAYFGVSSIPALAGRVATNLSAGAGSKTGAEIGQAIDQNFDTGGVATIVGGLAGGMGAPTLTNAVGNTIVTNAASGAKSVWNKYKDSGGIDKTLQSKAAANLLQKIASEEGAKNIDQILKDFDEISAIVGGEQFPLIVSLSQNKILKSELSNLVARKPEVRHQLEQELARLSTKIDEKADILFGGRAVSFVPTEINPQISLASQGARKAVDTIDQRIGELTDPLLTASRADTGNAIKNLVLAKEATVRKEISPKYEALLYEADAAGVVLPSSGAQQIWDFVQQNNMMDIFGRKTKAEGIITSAFKPKPVKGSEKLVMKDGELAWDTTLENKSPDVAFSNVESLKTEINRLLRTTTEGRDVNRLLELKAMLSDVRKQIGGDWSARLDALDAEYYKRVGIPYGERGVVDIKAKNYVEQVAPVLMKPSAMTDFLDIAGAEGVQIAHNTVLAKMYDAVVDPLSGNVNQRAMAKFVKDNRELIDTVPDLRSKIDDMVTDTDQLFLEREILNKKAIQAEKELSDAQLFALDPNVMSFSDWSNKVLKGGNMNEFLAKANSLDPAARDAVINRMRREVIATARRSDDPVGFFTNPEQLTNVRKLFGDQYVQDVKALAKLSKALDNADMSNVNYAPSARDVDPVKVATGVQGTYLLGQLRDRIASIQMKAARIFSKIYQGKNMDAQDAQLTELLFDPEGLRKLAGVTQRLNENGGKIDTRFVQDFTNTLRVVAPSNFAISTKEIARQANEPAPDYSMQKPASAYDPLAR